MVGLRKGPNGCNGATLGCQALDALTINCEPMPSLDTDRALSPRTWHDKGHEEPLGYGTNWQIGVSLCGAGPGIASCKGCPCDVFRPSGCASARETPALGRTNLLAPDIASFLALRARASCATKAKAPLAEDRSG